MKAALQTAKDSAKQAFDYDKLRTDTALKLTELETQAKRDLNKELRDNQGAVNGEVEKGDRKSAGV